MGINQKLLNIQSILKCNKGQYNSFGKYYYRSCEDILEAAKPICHVNGCTLTLSDEITMIGERFYIKAVATLTDIETGEQYQNVAYAREETEKRGMDGSQITGTASSYARKYCLNGLFCIDDTKDADTDEYRQQTQHKQTPQKTSKEKAELEALAKRKGADLKKAFQYFEVADFEHLSQPQLEKLKAQLEAKPDV